MHTQRSQNPKPDSYLTLAGLPVTIEMQWPFHGSGSGGDFYLLHGTMKLEDGSGLHADVAVQLSQTFKEQLASLERQDSESAVVNALRKELDRRQLELVKSGKKQPVPISSRHYNQTQGTGEEQETQWPSQFFKRFWSSYGKLDWPQRNLKFRRVRFPHRSLQRPVVARATSIVGRALLPASLRLFAMFGGRIESKSGPNFWQA